MKFLLVEDNRDLANAILSRMELGGHVVDHAANLEDASAFVATGQYDLILLDIMLPDGDGRSFLKQHRASDIDTPVIVLTARSQVSDRIGSLDLGADDYVTKPFDHAELEARCRAVLRRKSGWRDSVRHIGTVLPRGKDPALHPGDHPCGDCSCRRRPNGPQSAGCGKGYSAIEEGRH